MKLTKQQDRPLRKEKPREVEREDGKEKQSDRFKVNIGREKTGERVQQNQREKRKLRGF